MRFFYVSQQNMFINLKGYKMIISINLQYKYKIIARDNIYPYIASVTISRMIFFARGGKNYHTV